MNKQHQKTLGGIKDLSNPPIPVMPIKKGHFTLVSVTSVVAYGAALYHEQSQAKIRWVQLQEISLNISQLQY